VDVASGLHRAGRYRDLTMLLVKYGRSDLVRQARLQAALPEQDGAEATDDGTGLAADLERLGPTFIKLGQLLSTRGDLLPPAYLRSLARLQDCLPPVDVAEVRATIEDELGVRIARAFPGFDDHPLAAASLGQVHAATLRDGRPVVVKVQRPGVRREVFDDMEMLDSLAQRLERHTETGRMFAVAELLDRFRRSLTDELDYRIEASNLVQLAGIVAEQPLLVVPAPVRDLTSSRVLTMDRLFGRKVTELSGLGRLDIDGAGLARALFGSYLDQILVHGFFHADPHPGNVLLTEDGRLGLVDVGMVARVAPELRQQLVRLLLALGEQRGEEVARVLIHIGEPLAGFDNRLLVEAVALQVERAADATIGGLDAGRLVMDLMRSCAEARLRPPVELSMVAKALLNLDLVARTLDPDVVPVELVRERAVELAGAGMKPSLGGLLSAAMEAREFAEQLPGRLNRAVDAVAGGRFEVRVNAFDEPSFLQGLHRMANRVATGLVLAALIVGAALLSNVPTRNRIAGYPAVAFVLFTLAVLGGAWLVGSIVLADRRLRRRL
jgi:ubiquinone biosynthesis protein